MKRPRRTHLGPLAAVGLVVTVGWFALVAVLLTISQESWAILAAVLAGLAGLVTLWVALSLRVSTSASGIKIPGQPELPWEDIDSITIRPGLLHVPVACSIQGRGILEHPMEGLASSLRTARKLAQRVADAGGLGPIGDVEAPSGRRGARRAA